MVVKQLILLFAILLSSQFCIASSTDHKDLLINPTVSSDFDESLIKQRLRKLNSIVDVRFTSEVKSFVESYIKNYRSQSEKILGRSTIYFPYFDKALEENNLPEELKIISVLESALNPNAVSPAGAVGLWQFMPATASHYGLNYNSNLDERRDPTKSAQAAARYLKKLYSIYGDWAVSLAAYNAGPTRINNAIKSAGGQTDFWAIRKYLPRETQNYVPKYIALSYLFSYYNQHDLTPSLPELDLQITDQVTVFKKMNLKDIANKFDVPYETAKALNPMYKQGYIPASNDGMNIILPARVMEIFKNLIDNQVENKSLTGGSSANQYMEMTYTIGKSENITSISKKFNLHCYLVKFWNKLSSQILREGQTLKLFIFKNDRLTLSANEVLSPISTRFDELKSLMEDMNFIQTSFVDLSTKEEQMSSYLTHILGDQQTLTEIANIYEIPLSSLLQLNDITKDNIPVPGSVLKIRPLTDAELNDEGQP